MVKQDLLEVLSHIDPALLNYQDWVNVGMALKHEGYMAADWDRWSGKDQRRYQPGECFKKWGSFLGGSSSPVTGGTVVQLARDQGWALPLKTDEDFELDWDAVIGDKKGLVIVDRNWLEGEEVKEPENWNPIKELSTYLGLLFEASENVGYVSESYVNDSGKHLPSKGLLDQTAGQLIEKLNKHSDITNVIGDYRPEAGAWIRFNPLDGKGVKNENVTDFRYALVESDDLPIDKQNAVLRKLELPIVCMVHSGGRSLHAIVKIDAPDYDEYRKRVDYLYKVCQKNGLTVDTQNRNPSRLSRMPGVTRNGKKQFIVDTKIGKSTWAEWHEWIEGVNDDLPDPESLVSVWNDMPQLSPTLIDGVLRQGHKMLLAGPSKAGKSYLLIELCLAIAEGRRWLGWECAKGRVMYVNLELDRASCLNRFKDVYDSLGWNANNIKNIDIWNLRGKSVPMDQLAPKLIRRAVKSNYTAIVIDPIYKVITGDENSAGQMAHFANQFDKVCTELGAAVIYCHHHSKGYQGGKKSMDRASGSGVFARDPDALLDMTELELSPELRREHKDDIKTAWRIEGTLREFQRFKPVDIWFDYPKHTIDELGELKALRPESEKAPWERAIEKRKTPERKKEERQNAIEIAYASLEMEGNQITTADLAEAMGVDVRTVWRRVKEHGGLKALKSTDGLPSVIVRAEEAGGATKT